MLCRKGKKIITFQTIESISILLYHNSHRSINFKAKKNIGQEKLFRFSFSLKKKCVLVDFLPSKLCIMTGIFMHLPFVTCFQCATLYMRRKAAKSTFRRSGCIDVTLSFNSVFFLLLLIANSKCSLIFAVPIHNAN